MRKFSGGILATAFFAAISLAVVSPTPIEAFTVIGGPTIAGGQSHSLAVQPDGTVLGAGWNYFGQLGTAPSKPEFSPILGLSHITAVAATDHSTIALRSDGTVWTLGFNWLGELGRTSSSTPDSTPAPVPGLTGIVSIAAGDTHVVALREDGTVWTFGSNRIGELGWPTPANILQPNPTPRMVENLRDIVAVTAGIQHTVALRSDGTVWTFGRNDAGQLGPNANVGTFRPSWYPVPVPGLTGIAAISAGGIHTLALRNDGTVLGFGSNGVGQLGNSASVGFQPNPTPTLIPGLTNIIAVSAGDGHSVVLRSDGTVLTFGVNTEGQLGNGTNTSIGHPNPTPTPVAGVAGVTEIDAASGHTTARRADGSVTAWGGNEHGQLGVSTFPPLYFSLPVEVGVAAVPVITSRLVTMAPIRILDTRPASAVNYTGSKPANGSSTRLTVIGNPAVVVPTGATAITASITVTEATAPGFVQVFPTGAGTPGSSSNVNVERTGQTIANAITLPIGPDGTITLYSQSGAHLLVDITGYFVPAPTITTGGRMIPVTSTRILDTRPGSPVNYTGAKPGAASITRVRAAGVAPLPATGVSAVVLNVTATEASDVGFVQVGPAGSLTPGASSNLNVEFAGQTIPNQVIVPIGADGAIDIYSQSGTHLVVDVTAYITSAAATPGTDGLFVPINPTRVLDTRPEGPIGYGGGITPGAGALVAVDTTIGSTRIPVTGVSAVAANVTITQATAAGFVQAAASGTLVPGASSVLNANTVGQTIANAAVIPVTNARLDLFAQSGGHLVTDIFGWYTN